MMHGNWKLGALAAAMSLGVFGAVWADDDIERLDRRKSVTEEFSHAERAKAGDGDLEEVHFRYNLGYYRGSNGSQYYWPRFYAFRRGFADGSSGAGYHGGLAGRSSSSGSYSSVSQPMSGAVPAASGSRMSTSNYASPGAHPAMPDPEPPLAPAGPSDQHNGNPLPMPEPQPRMSEPAPRIDGGDDLIMRMEHPTKKYSYAAYGENRMQPKNLNSVVLKDKN